MVVEVILGTNQEDIGIAMTSIKMKGITEAEDDEGGATVEAEVVVEAIVAEVVVVVTVLQEEDEVGLLQDKQRNTFQDQRSNEMYLLVQHKEPLNLTNPTFRRRIQQTTGLVLEWV